MDYKEAIEYMRKESHTQCVNSEGQDAYIIAISAIQDLHEYHKLGTLEEIRESVEKQKAAHPLEMLGIFGEKEYECINCGNTVPHMDKYCKWCGKAQDWRYV